MGSITSVRVATDFSAAAQRSIERAALLIRQLGIAHGSVCHALDPHFIRAVRDLLPVLAEVEQKRGYAAESGLEKARRALEDASGIPFEQIVKEGDAASVLVEGSHPDELLIISAKGETSLADVVIGSTTERALRRSSGPVLVVQNPATQPYQKVLIPVDFTEDSQRALVLARELAPDAMLHIMHVIPPLPQEHGLQGVITGENMAKYLAQTEQRAINAMGKLLTQCNIEPESVTTIIEDGYTPMAINKKAVGLGVDLIAMGKHGETALSDWLLGSTTHYVVNHNHCDLLVAKA